MAIKDTTVIPGQGWIFYADPDTAPFNLKNWAGTDPTAGIDGWTWLGSTSKENLTALEKDGGEVTVKDTWDTPALRSSKSDTNWAVTVNSVSIAPETLSLAFPGGKFTKETGVYDVPAKETTLTKALMVVIKDSVNGNIGISFPRGTITLAGAPTLNAENFMEVPLKLTSLTSEATGNRISWILPESLASGAGVVSSGSTTGE